MLASNDFQDQKLPRLFGRGRQVRRFSISSGRCGWERAWPEGWRPSEQPSAVAAGSLRVSSGALKATTLTLTTATANSGNVPDIDTVETARGESSDVCGLKADSRYKDKI